MLQYPISVFLDTNIFISAKYDFSDKGIFNTFLNFVKAGKIKLYISNIVKGEVEKHINDELSKIYNSFKKSRSCAFETVSENYLNQWIFSYLFEKPDKTRMRTEMLEAFENFLQNTNATVLDCKNVDCDQIIVDYFAGNPPFANDDNKKYEFPDAIMISKLKNVFGVENHAFIVSNDKRFRDALQDHNGITTFETLKEIYDLINKEQEKMYANITQFLFQSDAHTELCKEIHSALDYKNLDIDGLDCDRKGNCEGYDYEEVYIDSIENVDFTLNSIDEITIDTIIVTVTATALISATCSFLDNYMWDSEEKKYIYSKWVNVAEEHQPEFECELIFEIKNESEYLGISLELKTVNFDLVLNQDTRISQEIIPSSDPAEDAYADAMDSLEEYYNH